MSSGAYEVRVRKDGSWSCQKQCGNEKEALSLGYKLRSDSAFDAIKVVKEEFDEDTGRFREKTIFSHFQQQGGSPMSPGAGRKPNSGKTAKGGPAGRSTAGKAAAPGLPQTARTSYSKSVFIIVSLAFLLVANVGFAILFADRLGLTGLDGGANSGNATAKDQAVRIYDLPAVTTNFMAADGEKIIHIRLGLKIENRERERAIDARLTDIVNGVLSELSRMKSDRPGGMIDIELLKKRLKMTVKSVSNEDIDEIMLKEILIF